MLTYVNVVAVKKPDGQQGQQKQNNWLCVVNFCKNKTSKILK